MMSWISKDTEFNPTAKVRNYAYLDKLDLRWTGNKPDHKFEREPYYTNGLNDKEWISDRRYVIFQNSCIVVRREEYL